jgi:hypothetical protein
MPSRKLRRRGSALPIAAVLVFLAACVGAVVVEYSFVSVAATELKHAAEGAALAGAGALAEASGLGEDEIGLVCRQVRQHVRSYASSNLVAGRPACSPHERTDSRESDLDVAVGERIRTEGGEEALWESSPNPDTVQVTLRRTRRTGHPIPVLMRVPGGPPTVDVTANAQASLDGRVTGFRATKELRVPAVPLGILATSSDWPCGSWQAAIVERRGADEFGYDRVARRVVGHADGVPEITLTAGGAETPANLVGIVLGRAGVSDQARQVHSGWSAKDLQPLGGAIEADATRPLSLPRSQVDHSLFLALADLRGQTRAWPLYVPDDSHPSHTVLVGFVAARILDVSVDRAGQHTVTVQPSLLVTATALTRGDGLVERNPYIRKLRISG